MARIMKATAQSSFHNAGNRHAVAAVMAAAPDIATMHDAAHLGGPNGPPSPAGELLQQRLAQARAKKAAGAKHA